MTLTDQTKIKISDIIHRPHSGEAKYMAQYKLPIITWHLERTKKTDEIIELLEQDKGE